MNISALLCDLEEREQRWRDEVEAFEPVENSEEEEEDDVEEEDRKIYMSIYEVGGEEGSITFCGFTYAELQLLFGVVERSLRNSWGRGRGRRSRFGAFDAFAITLNQVKHFGKWEISALHFKLKTATLQRMVKKVLFLVREPLLEQYFPKEVSMIDLRQDGNQFRNFPEAKFVADVTFQPCYRPKAKFEESKFYFSGKHHRYGLKVHSLHLPNGICVYKSNHEGGSVHDFSILSKPNSLAEHRHLCRKTDGDLTLEDAGDFKEAHPNQWCVLLDRGYMGALEFLRAVLPKRKPPGGTLTASEVARNKRISQDRIIVENFYGRMKQLWGVTREVYRWNHEDYDAISDVCFALTNFHISLHPLRQDDIDFYKRYKSMIKEEGKKQEEKEKRARKRSEDNRQSRIRFSSQQRNIRRRID